MPNPVVLTLTGNAVFNVQCHGFGPLEAATVDALLIRGNCATTNFPLVMTSDAAGNASFSGVATGCLAGSYSIQIVGALTTTELPIAFTF
jgi:hypothetical protein